MKKLILVRHAEAVSPKADRPDFERPLLPFIGLSDGLIHLLYEDFRKHSQRTEAA